ncbi:hypothetical protein A3G12_02525 [Candidatus Kaiserbacteria bacterium RIFCSPLOWO2_12_FULL_54_10]|nr:MAG: hypothetical protein A3G12_02525 [Candidatus Kaiserbacteria bacterium RIFCSPLOWO2_12_FULL_54_10]
MAKVENYIFVDEAGDPGPLFTIDSVTNKKEETGASSFYIITALCVSVEKLYLLEHRMMEVKNTFGYKKEIKSNEISLPLYKNLLDVVNELDIKTYFRLIDKSIYQGAFKVDGKPILHNVFDEFNVVRAVAFAIRDCDIRNVEVVIDRTDRRLLDGKFDSFNAYLEKKVSKLCDGDNHRVSHVTHVNSEYVNAMQMSDIISGAIRDDFTKKNKELMKVIASERLILATGKYDRKIRKTKGGV